MTARKFVSVLVLALVLVLTAVPMAGARSLDGAISGLALLPNGKPAAGVQVQAWQGRYTGLYSKDWDPYGTPVVTGRNGSYKLTVPPGTYRVWFRPGDLETYCMEAYPNAPTTYAGDDVVVRAGRTTTRVSVTLDGSPGVMEGWVYDASTGAPLEGILLKLGFQGYAIVNPQFGDTLSNAEGYYRFAGLKSWSWGAWAFDERGTTPRYLELLNFDENTWVEQGGVTTLNFDLEPEGWVSLTGRITDESLAGIEGVSVAARQWEGDGYWDFEYTTTDATGAFQFVNLPAGQYMFWASSEVYEDRYYNGDQEGGEEIWIERGNAVTLGEWTLFPNQP